MLHRFGSWARPALACLIFTGIGMAQSSSGVISGRVLDTTADAIPGATVVLTRQGTGETRTFITSALGEFVLTSIQPGTYDLEVRAQGFKNLQKTGLVLSASERLSAGDLKLQLGSVSESVDVKADATPVQVSSSERSAVIDTHQITNLMTRGRDLMGLLVILPGVVNDGEGSDSLGVFNSPASISGTRGVYGAMNLDGISGNTRSGDHLDTPINIDAVAEVQVLQNTYQAEYGKGAGGIINVVTKTGTRQYHGLAYYYVRNEAFNANNFFSNRQGFARGRYRYNTVGGYLGGPVYIPGKFNSDKQKLFFFYSQEYLPNQEPNGPRNYTVPTALERAGDFSQTFDSKGKLITVSDPFNRDSSGKAIPFARNVVPPSRLDPNMLKLLNIFPLPNATGKNNNGAYNYQIQDTLWRPGQQQSLRVDYNISNNLHAFFRGTNEGTHNKGPASTVNRFAWMPDANVDYALTGPNVGGAVTWILSPTLVNEAIVGYALWTETQIVPDQWLAEVQRNKLGVTLGQLYPQQNPLNLIPAMSFGGISNVATTAWEGRFPMRDEASSWSFTDNLSKIWNTHQFKIGVQWEHVHYLFEQSGKNDIFAGSFAFGPNSNNPFTDSGYAYANAVLGYFNTYTESTNRSQYSPVTPILEWYVQDSWRVKPRLTFDIGVRFTAGFPQYPDNNVAATFVPSLYDPSKAPLLYLPGLDKNKQRVAVDPRSGATLPSTYIGQIVPGTGNPKNGIVVSGDPNYPRALVDFQGIMAAPRAGFAWDVFGDGKTALRGGFGVNYNPRNGSGILGDLSTNPPLVLTPTENYGTTKDYLNLVGTQSPSDFSHSLNRSNIPARVYNTSLGIQRRIGFQTVFDVAYVGSFGRHIGQTTDINLLPYGTRFLPQNQDPTQTGNKPMLDQFLRPYFGYGSIPWLQFDGNSSYHSLQVQLTRRLSHGLQYGVAWTWSKAMDYSDGDQGKVTTFLSRRIYDYGEASYDRTHVLAIHYLWDIPRASRLVNNGVVKKLFDNWEISGITRFQSGAPLSLGILGTGAFTPSTDITGGGDGWRPIMTGNPILPSDQRTVEHWFNASAFAPPVLPGNAPADLAGVMRILALGNTPPTIARGPGLSNFNVALFKIIPIGEHVKATFRAEAYNVFNHTQFRAVDVAPQWDKNGVQTKPLFGQVTSARDPRIMQFALRLSF